MDRAGDPRSGLTSAEPTLHAEIWIFLRHREPQLLVGFLAVGLVARVVVGGFALWDVVVVTALIIAMPFIEWLLHRHILHFTPRSVFGRQVDLHPRRAHARHHEFVNDSSTVFIGPIGIVVVIVGVALLAALAMPTGALSLTFVLTGMALALVYEWTHYLIHRSYRAKGRTFRRIRRGHLRHHNVDEHRNFGITSRIADHVLRTAD